MVCREGFDCLLCVMYVLQVMVSACKVMQSYLNMNLVLLSNRHADSKLINIRLHSRVREGGGRQPGPEGVRDECGVFELRMPLLY